MYLHSNSTMYLYSKKPFGKNYVYLSVCVVSFPHVCDVKIMIIYFVFFGPLVRVGGLGSCQI